MSSNTAIVPYWLFGLLLFTVGHTALADAAKDVRIQELERQLKQSQNRVEQLEEMVINLGGDPDEVEDADQAIDMAESEDGDFFPWTHYMRRSTMNTLAPSAVTIPKGQFFSRFIHTSKETTNRKAGGNLEQTEPFHNFLGLDESVRIGLMFGYGIADNWDVTVQRTNGRTMVLDAAPDFSSIDITSFDYWDVMTKYQLLNQYDSGVDLAITGGVTYMMEDNENGTTAWNGGLIAERSLLNDRVRLTSGVLYTSDSAYESTQSAHPDAAITKRNPRELGTFGNFAEGNRHTVSVPLNLRLALTKDWMLFAESIFPVGGFQTGQGPTLALGTRINTTTHEYNLYVTNSSNTSFNSVLTGGYLEDRLDIFGFNITIFY